MAEVLTNLCRPSRIISTESLVSMIKTKSQREMSLQKNQRQSRIFQSFQAVELRTNTMIETKG